MTAEKFTYQDSNTTYQGYLAQGKTTNKRPGVLVVPDAAGCGEFVKNKAEKLAELGYVSLAVDMYGDGKVAKVFAEAMQIVKPIMSDRALVKHRILTAFEALKKISTVDTTKIAAIGFCFGGLTVLDLARSGTDVAGVVSFHGALHAPEGHTPQPIKAKVLAMHGYADKFVTPDHVTAFAQEMTTSNADWQIHMYGHTMHAFTNPQADDPEMGRQYNAAADHRSWISMKNFFAEIF